MPTSRSVPTWSYKGSEGKGRKTTKRGGGAEGQRAEGTGTRTHGAWKLTDFRRRAVRTRRPLALVGVVATPDAAVPGQGHSSSGSGGSSSSRSRGYGSCLEALGPVLSRVFALFGSFFTKQLALLAVLLWLQLLQRRNARPRVAPIATPAPARSERRLIAAALQLLGRKVPRCLVSIVDDVVLHVVVIAAAAASDTAVVVALVGSCRMLAVTAFAAGARIVKKCGCASVARIRVCVHIADAAAAKGVCLDRRLAWLDRRLRDDWGAGHVALVPAPLPAKTNDTLENGWPVGLYEPLLEHLSLVLWQRPRQGCASARRPRVRHEPRGVSRLEHEGDPLHTGSQARSARVAVGPSDPGCKAEKGANESEMRLSRRGVRVCVCVCVRVCVRACVRVCVRVCVLRVFPSFFFPSLSSLPLLPPSLPLSLAARAGARK